LKCGPNASCTNHPFRIECRCNYGFSGDGLNYCDECGLTQQAPGLKIVGGQDAVPHSWPATAIIYFTYRTRVNINGHVRLQDYSAQCGGTLIDRTTVLTAAHCIITEFTITDDQTGTVYIYDIKPNEFYPTIAVT
jgi:hypothetical protein